jgi:triacylglycerol lipase
MVRQKFITATIALYLSLLATAHMAGAAAMTSNMSDSPAKKEIPAFTAKNISPPYLDYPYFVGHDRYPFEPKADTFSMVNAWWMAEAATLAYAHEPFAREGFGKAGLHEVRFFDNRSTQCYVASNTQFAIAVFRGSEVWRRRGADDGHDLIADLWTNADFRLADWSKGGKVHRGFKSALDEVWKDLEGHIRMLKQRGCTIWMTGHSLGAALATLAAHRFGDVQGVYTFGGPRVGNKDFKNCYSVQTYRFVNGHDIVCFLPPQGFYVHVGEVKHIDAAGSIQSMVNDAGHLSGMQSGREGGFRADSGKAIGPQLSLMSAVIDHVPTLYAIYIWNQLIDLPGMK